MANRFSEENYNELCDKIIQIEPRFSPVVERFGYPPLWHRKPDFATLILTILEQQVSLAAAAAAYKKLEEKIKNITPENILRLTDEGLRECYFSRQKMVYARHLATEIQNRNLDLEKLSQLPEEKIRRELIKIKGIGEWTIDMYLLLSLNYADIFPVGDLATVKAMKELKLVKPESSKDELINYMDRFRPYRSIATYLLWHDYIQKRGLKL